MTFAPSLLAAAFAASFTLAAQAGDIPLTGTGNGGSTGSFVQTSTDLFIDTFTFTPASPSGRVSVTLSNLGSVSFFTASLNDQNFSYFPELGLPNFSFQALVDTMSTVTLTVFGAVLDADGNLGMGNTGSYGGTINVLAAVPEPSTYALMAFGLAALGWKGRRRPAG